MIADGTPPGLIDVYVLYHRIYLYNRYYTEEDYYRKDRMCLELAGLSSGRFEQVLEASAEAARRMRRHISHSQEHDY